MASSSAWYKIFKDYDLLNYDFSKESFRITAEQIKQSTRAFQNTVEREVRTLCKQDKRVERPQVFKDAGVFILPVKNGEYVIIKGEGYIDIPEITSDPINYDSKLEFHLDTAVIGNSEMQHLDMAYASSIIRTFMNDDSLVLTIRGRKRTPEFTFKVGEQEVKVESVQTEVDGGYEGRDKVVLVEAKSENSKDTIIRQLFYPYKQWQLSTNKKVYTLFFERDFARDLYNIWQFEFTDENNYNSINLVKSSSYKLKHRKFEEKPSIPSE